MKRIGRRDFLKKAAGSTIAISLMDIANPFDLRADVDNSNSEIIPKRTLGRTGFEVSIVSLGGQSTIERPGRRDESVEIINRALDLGINYIDTSEVYGNGISESYIGEVMRDRRDEVFLTTKTFQRTASGIEDVHFARSCERLQTDFIDLYLLHAINRRTDLDAVLNRENGAILGFEKLREKGRIGHIGLSSHSTAVLTEALNRYDFDCVFLTLNPAGMSMSQSPAETRAFLETIREKNVGVIAMKVTGRNGIFDTGITMEQALTYTLSAGRSGNAFPIATAAIGITNVSQVDENVRLAKQYSPFTDEEMDRLEESVVRGT